MNNTNMLYGIIYGVSSDVHEIHTENYDYDVYAYPEFKYKPAHFMKCCSCGKRYLSRYENPCELCGSNNTIHVSMIKSYWTIKELENDGYNVILIQ